MGQQEGYGRFACRFACKQTRSPVLTTEILVVSMFEGAFQPPWVTWVIGRELPSVMAAACKALEGAMNIEATALGVAGLLEDLSI